ncbi:hypothetical protein ZIOFF_056644 [Zingiber officinale]|uniref:RRM domain-containing protein n=1 Tax=Zingiber officinale TaxID=94328 RepID=A0A8J5FIA6_ZINOF|nr:hypothetical protein ZIOFF_056644 [Zingiber officinale]
MDDSRSSEAGLASAADSLPRRSHASLRWAILRRSLLPRPSSAASGHPSDMSTKKVSRKKGGGFNLIPCRPLVDTHLVQTPEVSRRVKILAGPRDACLHYKLPLENAPGLVMIQRMEESLDLYDFQISRQYDIDTTGLVCCWPSEDVLAWFCVDHRDMFGHHREKKEDGAAEPEADPERDQRTVFAYQLSLKADERDVYEFFSKAGKVRDVRLIMDRNSRRSKGVGYIEFYDVMSVPMAIALSGQLLLGQPVMVKPSEAEKNLVQSNTTAGGTGLTGPNSGAARRLYVGNLHLNITEPQLRQVFEPFGQVELVQLPLDPLTGLCKGYGFIQVSAVTDQTGVQDTGTNAADLDDDEGGGLSLNASSRALLMQKLAGTAGSIPGTLAAPAANPALLTPAASILGPSMIPSILQPSVPPFVGLPTSGLPVASTAAAPPLHTAGVPSECLLLKNMFDPTVESEPDFDLDIKEDVHDECSKFGTVKHIYVDKNSAGYVYLHFDDVTSSMKAQNALHGRWFAGKMITATYMAPQQYMAKFPNAS